ncbi:hypothetical protein L6452_12232 [Arctium lappa]|uniref:Uncharacterized protein n=1 Tax=Arctium lappa TaxID=4217 RepID=A0ACB9DQK4_ARCLA|nr:hypothetical protein L6452_12232 [Arctium lappa]
MAITARSQAPATIVNQSGLGSRLGQFSVHKSATINQTWALGLGNLTNHAGSLALLQAPATIVNQSGLGLSAWAVQCSQIGDNQSGLGSWLGKSHPSVVTTQTTCTTLVHWHCFRRRRQSSINQAWGSRLGQFSVHKSATINQAWALGLGNLTRQ